MIPSEYIKHGFQGLLPLHSNVTEAYTWFFCPRTKSREKTGSLEAAGWVSIKLRTPRFHLCDAASPLEEGIHGHYDVHNHRSSTRWHCNHHPLQQPVSHLGPSASKGRAAEVASGLERRWRGSSQAGL